MPTDDKNTVPWTWVTLRYAEVWKKDWEMSYALGLPGKFVTDLWLKGKGTVSHRLYWHSHYYTPSQREG